MADGEGSYPPIAQRLEIRHEPINLVASKRAAHEALPAVHQVSSLLKRWLAGTLHDGISTTHLSYYLDEYTFRFNPRSSRSSGLLWHRLVQQAVNRPPPPQSAPTQDLIPTGAKQRRNTYVRPLEAG